MNVLVTGGLGHIGSRLIRRYGRREEVDRIRVFDDFSSKRYPSLFDLPKTTRYEVIEGDVRDVNAVSSATSDIDLVIHLAAITDAPSTLEREEETFEVNLTGTKNVVRAALDSEVDRLLFPSTTSVYGQAEGVVDEEFGDFKPSTPYAEAKLEAERFLQSEVSERGLPAVILRMGTIFGTSPGMRFHTVVNKFCYRAALGKPLTVWEDALDQYRPYLNLTDDVNAFQFLETEGEDGEVYNVLTGNYTVRNLVDIIRDVIDVEIEYVESPLINQKSYKVDNGKISQEGFQFEGDLGTAVRETIDLFSAVDNSDI